jgi:hypothetical protein
MYLLNHRGVFEKNSSSREAPGATHDSGSIRASKMYTNGWSEPPRPKRLDVTVGGMILGTLWRAEALLLCRLNDVVKIQIGPNMGRWF